MMRAFNTFIASLRYLFVLAVLALAVLAMGSLARGVFRMAEFAVAGGFVMEPGSGAAVVPYFIRAAFLYFLAVSLGSLFVGDLPAPQWMTVKNLFQFRTKVLTFVSIILPLAFMGKMMDGGTQGAGILYTGAGVFLVLLGIFFLIRFTSPSGDEGMAREGNRPAESRPRESRRPGERASASKQAQGSRDKDEWLRKKKEDLRFQKESMEKTAGRDVSGESGERQTSNVTVKPGPRRPRGRR